MREKFWQKYALDELQQDEWEALCDGCALCCLHKLEDEDTGDIAITDVYCRHLNIDECRCGSYDRRHVVAPECMPLDVNAVRSIAWLPDTCAYRRLAENKALPEWHYLESGDRALVHQLSISVRDQSISETMIHPDLWEERVIRWVYNDEGRQ